MCGVNSVLAAGVLDLCGVDIVLYGIGQYVCDVNSVMSAGVFDLCGVYTMVAGVDEPVCGVSSVMTPSQLDVCGCDSVVSDETGNSSGVDVVVSSDDAGGGWLPVIGNTLMCGAGLARSDRGDTEVVVGPGVVQPGWVDRLICADGSLRAEPPPMQAKCLRHMLLTAAC